MPKNDSISFVVPVNDEKVYNDNFLNSPLFKTHRDFEIIKQCGYISASKAFNDAIRRANNEIIVLAHQDMFFPAFWGAELKRALSFLEKNDPDWGVIGCYGHDVHGVGFGYMYCVGNRKLLGKLTELPTPVQTLDEVVLILRKSSGMQFDESLPYYHLYGADICMQATKTNKRCYAISAFCLHNTNKLPFLPDAFFDCYKYIKKKWFDYLPIDTTCIRIEKHGIITYIRYKYLRKFKHNILRKYLINKNLTNHNSRCIDPIKILNDLQKRNKLYWD